MRILLFLLACCFLPPAWAVDAQHLDVRILIDVSGSMKRTDPENLRQPALRLLSELLPPGAQAGIWSFEREPVNLLPVQRVDDAWRQKALKSSMQIHSRGLFTNIESAIATAAADWLGAAAGPERHLILLTDGMVDVSPQETQSQASRERILSKVLPELKQAQVRVHSVALSQEADRDLLYQLSRETGGIFEAIETPERLQRVFLGLFEQASKPDALPLKDNQFVVDQSIKEATVILFRAKGAAPVALIDPQGKSYSQTTKAANMRWFQDQGYELITITQPLPGQWQVQAEMDPDNRVLVVTDLKMQLNSLPTQALALTRLDLMASFRNNNEPLDKAEFLRLVQVSGQVFEQGSIKPRQELALLPRIAAGGFGAELLLPELEGNLELVVQGRSETFSRQIRHRMTLRQALKLSLDDTNPDAIKLRVKTDAELLDPQFELALKTKAGSQPKMLEPISDQQWQLELSAEDFVGEAELQLLVKGQYLGQAMELRPAPIRVQGRKQEAKAKPEPEPAPETKPEPKPEPVVQVEEPKPEAPEPAPAAAEEADEAKTPLDLGWIIFGLANVFGIGLFGLAYWLWRKRSQASIVDILDDGHEPSAQPQTTEADKEQDKS